MGFKKFLVYSGIKNISKNISSGKLSAKKLAIIAAATIITAIVVFFIVLVLAVFLIRWVWNSGNNTVQQNPTVSSIVETTKQEVADIVPSVPSAASDFIINGQVDTAKLAETYANLPAQTQQIWKAAMEKSIAEAVQSATGADITALQQLLAAVRGL
jgi:predicted PurR-regulated permease PerM